MNVGNRHLVTVGGLTNSPTAPVIVMPQPLFKSQAAQMAVDNCCCLLATLGNRRYCEWVWSLRRERVSPRVERFLENAKECERMAAHAKKRQADFFVQDARQWRDLARQAGHWECVRDMMPENLRRDQSTPLLPHIELGDELGLRGGSSENSAHPVPRQCQSQERLISVQREAILIIDRLFTLQASRRPQTLNKAARSA
jgi:hypothetical protein